MVKKIAPFQVGGIVQPPYFIGREIELAGLVRGLRTLSQNYLILGPRRIGKSSLLANVARRLKKELNVVEINCLEAETPKEFSNLLIEAILKSYEKQHPSQKLLKIFRGLKSNLLESLKSIEKVGGSFKKLVEVYISFKEKKIEAHELIMQTFNFIEKFVKEKNLKLVIIFDEFQKVAEFNSFIFKFLKSHIDRTPRVRYAFSGSSISLLRDVFFKPGSPLYLMTSKFYLKPLAKEKIKNFIHSRLRIFKLSITNEALEELVNQSGGMPFYFQKLGNLCYELALEKKLHKIEKEHIKEAFNLMLNEFASEFEERFEFAFSPRQRAILKAIALGAGKISVIARALELKVNELGKDSRLLLESLTLERVEKGRYIIRDKVFKQWLNFKFQKV